MTDLTVDLTDEVNSITIIAKKLKKLALLSDEKLNNLADALVDRYQTRLLTLEDLEKLAKELGIANSIMIESIPAVLTAYVNSLTSDRSFKEVLERLAEGTLEPAEVEQIGTFFSKTHSVFKSMWEDLDRKICPQLPIDEFMRMRTRIINVAEYVEEFGLKDDVNQYKPVVKRLHLRALLTFYAGRKGKSFYFVATEDDIDDIIKWLQLTRKQFKVVIDNK